MSNFEHRVAEVVAPQLEEILNLFQSPAGKASTKTIDDLYDLADRMFNLLKDVKSEVNKTERQTVPDEEEEKKKKKPEVKKPTREQLKQLWDLLTDDDPRNIQQLVELIKQIEPTILPKPLPGSGHPDFEGGIVVDDDTTLLEWITNQPDMSLGNLLITKIITQTMSKLLDKQTDTIPQQTTKDVQAFVDYSRKYISDHLDEVISDCCTTMGDNLDQLSRDMKECCDETHNKLDEANSGIEDANRKIDLLDPVTNANNVLEILQRMKALQSSIDELRGYL